MSITAEQWPNCRCRIHEMDKKKRERGREKV